MKITVISSDRFIAVNGIGLTVPDHQYNADIEAIQYDTDHKQGSIQRVGGADPFTDGAILVPYVNSWIETRKHMLAEFEKRTADLAKRAQETVAQANQQLDTAQTALKQLAQ